MSGPLEPTGSPAESDWTGRDARRPAGRIRSRLVIARTTFAAAAASAVLILYAWHGLTLLRYPWDWMPDEGLGLDFGLRLLRAQASLFPPGSVVPFPCAYGPGLPLLLAPFLAVFDNPIVAGRAAACVWTTGSVLAVYWLVRQAASPVAALVGAALSVAAFDMSYWQMLVRVDGLATALFLAAALPLLPRELRPGADSLGGARIAFGTVFALLAILTKPTAVLHCAPLIVGWWLVDRRSAWKLTATGLASLAASIALVQWATGGGFLGALGIWSMHRVEPGNLAVQVQHFAVSAAPLLVLYGVFLLLAAFTGQRPWHDASLLLVMGAASALPTMAKHGALWSYLSPALPALGVATGRWASKARECWRDE